MWETRPVELVVDLPHDIASSVEEVSHRDPDYLRRVIRYGIARRMVYQALERRLGATGTERPSSGRDAAAAAADGERAATDDARASERGDGA